MRAIGAPPAAHLLWPLEALQNSYLQRITGGYRRTLRRALERETMIPPIDLHIEATRYHYANRIWNNQVESQIASTMDAVWVGIRPARAPQERPQLLREVVALQA